jgi:polygalacturonase
MNERETSRREFLKQAGLAGLGLLLPTAAFPGGLTRAAGRGLDLLQAPAVNGWAGVDGILARIKPPTFPNRVFALSEFGAVGDGEKDCTGSFRDAIAACNAAGGGRVIVPAGRFLTGPIHLKSGVDLHLSDGTVVQFSRDPRHYLPVVFTRWEGVELMNYSPFIYALDQQNIAITGRGTLDGQANEEYWWRWKGGAGRPGASNQNAARERLMEMGMKGVPVAERVFGEGHYLRPNFIQPYRCKNVLVEGVTIVNSSMWEIHPVLCTNVTVRGVTINSHGPNNDGCDPESCRDVLIEGCRFDTGDDCIALKSGRNNDGRRLNMPVENVIIRDCVMADGHGGVVIGSEISGGARNVFAEKCRMDSPQLDRALRIKTNSVRGGTVEHVYMRDVTVGQVAEAVVTVNYFYEEGDAGAWPPVVRDVEVRRVTSRKSKYVLLLRGYRHDPIQDVRLVDCSFEGVSDADVIEHVRGLKLTNVRINGQMRKEEIGRDAEITARTRAFLAALNCCADWIGSRPA